MGAARGSLLQRREMIVFFVRMALPGVGVGVGARVLDFLSESSSSSSSSPIIARGER